MKGFDKSYWRTNYTDFKTIDGIGNVRDHSRYVKAYFQLEGFEPKTMIDLGYGYGKLLKEFMRVFRPRRTAGIEPSSYVFEKVKIPGARLENLDLLSWAQSAAHERVYDLGLCQSVLQYVPSSELKQIIPVLARRLRYLYLTVPTDIEYQRQAQELQFSDPWAKARSQAFYVKLLRPHFTFISCRILESKFHYNAYTTEFQDLLYRF
jgi:SAM-dependent methyltransferase